MKIRKLAAATALFALPAQTMAQPACLTRDEAETVVTALLPSLMQNVYGRCRAFLPADAALMERGGAFVERYAGEAFAAREAATPIVSRMILAGEDAPSEDALDPAIALDAMEVAVGVELAGQMSESACGIANGIFAALEPLPAANFARLVVVFLEIGQRRPDRGPTPFGLCQDEG